MKEIIKEIYSLDIETSIIISKERLNDNSFIINLKGGLTLFVHANTIGLFSTETIMTKDHNSIEKFNITLAEYDLSTIMEDEQNTIIH